MKIIAAAALIVPAIALASPHPSEHLCENFAHGARAVAEHYYEYGYATGSILIGSGSSIGDQFMAKSTSAFVSKTLEEYNDNYSKISASSVERMAFAHCMGI